MSTSNRRVYVDTSVFGGCFDEEFEEPSRKFFAEVREGRFQLVESPLVREEIGPAPEEVREFHAEMLSWSEVIEISERAIQLRNAYLKAEIVAPKSESDALHVALATTSGCEMIVSWNFSHIVHSQKIPLYNAVNILNGYPEILIYSPREVITYEE